ncbi:MAG: hypothetical protein ACLGI6_03135 [Gammaproteobacteria bacterium]
MDNDVALLAALVAHTKSSSASHQSKIALQYKQCAAQPSVAKADRCREHICANSGKNDPVCKPKRPSKASGES